MLQERCRPLAQSGVIEAPRVQLENGLLRTKQKPTSLPTLHDNTRSRGAAKKFHTRRVGTTGEQLEKKSRGPAQKSRPKQNLLVHPRNPPHRQVDAILSAAATTLECSAKVIDAKDRHRPEFTEADRSTACSKSD